jgi:hypothetical protein
MKFQFNDGGRAAAGFKGSAGDCVTRAVAIASGRPYLTVYNELSELNANRRVTKRARSSAGKRSARNGVPTKSKAFHDYMRALGFVWVSTMGIGTGCRVHLDPDELPLGRLVVRVSKHACAVIDGVVHDTFEDDRGGSRCVYGYWKLCQNAHCEQPS